jgi:nitrite reductase/ring-hydroxylating ferredoxin subunit
MTVPLKWIALAEESEIPEGKATLVSFRRTDILVFHVNGVWTAYDNTCPHAGAPIYAEHFDGDCVTCVYHGLRFRASDGVCPESPGWELEPYPVKVVEGRVMIGFKDFG